jgi:hypothetical protein
MQFQFFRKVRDVETGCILNNCGMLPSFHMNCGPSGAEENLAGGAQSLSSTMSSDFNSRFANQSNVLSQLNSSLSPILAAGPGQQGYTPQEAAAISTATINNAAGASRQAQQKVQSTLAGRGDGSGLTSGVDKQILGSVASTSANNLANAQTANTVANYEKGSENYWRAQGALQTLGAGEDATQFGSLADTSQSNAFGEANQVQQQKNQRDATIAGGITGLASAAIPFANSSNFLSSIGGGKVFGSGSVFGGG